MTTAPADNARARTARARWERSRAALLQAAEQLFGERGWHGARMEDIAAAAGLSTATAYNHFPTKHALIGNVYAPRILAALAQVDARLAAGGGAVDGLIGYVRDLTGCVRDDRPLTQAFVSAVLELAVRRGGPVDMDDKDDPRRLAPAHLGLQRLIELGQQQGLLRAHPPAPEIAAQVINLLLIRVLTRPDEGEQEMAELVLTMLFGVLRPQLLVERGERPFAAPLDQ